MHLELNGLYQKIVISWLVQKIQKIAGRLKLVFHLDKMTGIGRKDSFCFQSKLH